MRLKFARSLLVALGMVALSSAGQAQPFPSKVITIVVPFPAGGATDVVARAIAQGLSTSVGHQVIVDNRPGANGSLGSALVAKAKPDGYTLVMGGVNTHAMNDALYKKLPYNSLKDFSPITLTARIPVAFVVHPSLPVNSIGELIALAKSQPGQLSYGSSGAGGPHHLAMELFKSMAKVDIVHVPYKGGAPQLNDLLGGHIKIVVAGPDLARGRGLHHRRRPRTKADGRRRRSTSTELRGRVVIRRVLAPVPCRPSRPYWANRQAIARGYCPIRRRDLTARQVTLGLQRAPAVRGIARPACAFADHAHLGP
jgi:hypothetical protein